MSTLALPTLDAELLAVARDPARYRVLVAGRRRGKSTCAVVVAADGGWRGQRVLWVSPTYRQSLEAYAAAKRLLATVPVVRVRESTATLEFPSGGSIEFRSGDAPDSLRGAGYDLVVVDEAAYVSDDLWPTLRPALAERRGRALFISTPRRVGDAFHGMFLRGQDGADPEWRSWQTPTAHAPHVPAAEVEAAARSMGSVDFAREFEARFVGAEGARVKREWLRVGLPPPVVALALGCDLAISERAGADYTALVAMGRDADGDLWVLDARRTRAPFHQVLRFIVEAAAELGPDVVVVEDVAYQRGVVTELQRTTSLNVRGVRPAGDKGARFAPLEGRIESGLLRLAPDLPPAYADELCSFPVGAHDDFCDATALAFAALAAPPDRYDGLPTHLER